MPRGTIAPAAPSQMFSLHKEPGMVEEQNGQPQESQEWIQRRFAKPAVFHLVLLEAVAVAVLLTAIFAPMEKLACFTIYTAVICANTITIRIVAGAMAVIALCLGIPVCLSLVFYKRRLLRIFPLLTLFLYGALFILLLFVSCFIVQEIVREQPKGTLFYQPWELLGLLIAALTSAHGAWTNIKFVMCSPQRESAPLPLTENSAAQ